MVETLRGDEVKLKVGQITQVEGVWFRVHKITKRDLVFRRLNADKVAHAERVKAAQELQASSTHEFAGDDADCLICGEGRLHYIHPKGIDDDG